MAARSSEAAPEWQEYNNLIREIKTETDVVEREALMHQAEDMLMESGAIVPLYYYNDIYRAERVCDRYLQQCVWFQIFHVCR